MPVSISKCIMVQTRGATCIYFFKILFLTAWCSFQFYPLLKLLLFAPAHDFFYKLDRIYFCMQSKSIFISNGKWMKTQHDAQVNFKPGIYSHLGSVTSGQRYRCLQGPIYLKVVLWSDRSNQHLRWLCERESVLMCSGWHQGPPDWHFHFPSWKICKL